VDDFRCGMRWRAMVMAPAAADPTFDLEGWLLVGVVVPAGFGASGCVARL